MAPSAQLTIYAVSVLAFVGLLAFRMRRMTKSQPLKLERLWIMPAIFLVITGMSFLQFPVYGLDLLWLGPVLALGAGIGWYRGKMMHISVDPATHDLNVKASPAALIFLVVLVVTRLSMRSLMTAEAGAWHLSLNLITDAFSVFALGLFGVQRLEMFIRGRRLLTEARSAGKLVA